MKKPFITFLNHASFIVQINNIKILVDPYLFGSAFNDGWNLLKELDHSDQIKEITHIFYSHEHPDHFSIPFLKKVDSNIRKNITILYQDTFDKRIKYFCENLGYKFKEFRDGIEEKIDKDLYICIGKVPFYDSWINFRINNTNILNVNDCVLENPKLVFDIKKILNRKIDVLFTQFSYANFIEKDKQKIRALQQLEKIKIQDQILNPTYLIPFASFIYFSHLENKFMNENINSVRNTYEFIIKNCKTKPIILVPNEQWNLKDKKNDSSLKFWDEIYKNLSKLNYHSIKKNFNSKELINEGKKYIERLNKKNNKLLKNFLCLIGFFPSIKIHITDINKYYDFSITKELKEILDNKVPKKFISLSSESLMFIFKYDYGFDTLQVNARLKCDDDYLKKVTKCLIIGSLNNTGRYIKISNFYKYLNINFIIRGLEILNLKKRHY